MVSRPIFTDGITFVIPADKFNISRNKTIKFMLRWTITFLIIAIIAAVFGFGGIAAGAAGIAKVLFFLFLVLFVISLISGTVRRP